MTRLGVSGIGDDVTGGVTLTFTKTEFSPDERVLTSIIPAGKIVEAICPYRRARPALSQFRFRTT